ncbi:hypothetical protein H1D32_08365 [Anaerobacillus sp. CMMVII]|uniref:hypothetical protein n=1 Tax=Anaerobacillus sp. CMMVII TaxID=2755588 RepID=UPI0021B83D67|nr:hypothetical protein [Anaerobacillus sp. CMMVII]MCT8137769.1 hypothetical protein [Anaerobacillus sp. CMMVII]
MDMTRTVKPLYTFDYILNPAKNWSDFGGLQIRIIPPEQAPYIVSSSVDLVKDENNMYLTNLAQLPEEDLTFTLYADEEITEKGQIKEFFNVMPIVILTIILFILGVVFLFRRKK